MIAELYYIDLSKYKELYPEVRTLLPEIQTLRYDHFEHLRQNSIQSAIRVK